MTPLLVLLGGAAGAVARLLVSRAVPGRVGTLLVNLLGSLALGLLAGAVPAAAPLAYALLGTGFCGALTTFSTFAVEVVEGGGWRYAATTTAGCLLACALGLAVSGQLSRGL